MAQELGRLERPEAAPFRAERKIYLISLVFAPPNPPADYLEILKRYWSGADEHIGRLEARIGEVKHVYMELADRGGEEGLKLAEQISAGAAGIARSRTERGATFEALEDPETLAEAMDWERCLFVGLMSRKATDYVTQAYREASRRRYELMAKRIDETLKQGEAGLAFLGERHRVQFPESIRVFYVAPPALDEVHRWLRDYQQQPPQPAKPGQAEAPGESARGEQGGAAGGGGQPGPATP